MEEPTFLPLLRAVLFDLGGVLLEIDWERYGEDKHVSTPIQNLWPHDYERLNAELVRFLVQLRPLYKLATICNGGSREAMNRKFRLGTPASCKHLAYSSPSFSQNSCEDVRANPGRKISFDAKMKVH